MALTTEKCVIYLIIGIALLMLIMINVKLSDIRKILEEQKNQERLYRAQDEIKEIEADLEKHSDL